MFESTATLCRRLENLAKIYLSQGVEKNETRKIKTKIVRA